MRREFLLFFFEYESSSRKSQLGYSEQIPVVFTQFRILQQYLAPPRRVEGRMNRWHCRQGQAVCMMDVPSTERNQPTTCRDLMHDDGMQCEFYPPRDGPILHGIWELSKSSRLFWLVVSGYLLVYVSADGALYMKGRREGSPPKEAGEKPAYA
eukprot:scaffold7012_cov157-Amphora_coffeaeformis.AAC.7